MFNLPSGTYRHFAHGQQVCTLINFAALLDEVPYNLYSHRFLTFYQFLSVFFLLQP